jgi:hypothetical protein
MRAYIQHRLEVAGAGDRQVFAEEAFAEVYRYTGGVPRLINTLCDTAMMAAFSVDRDHVGMEDISSAAQELRWVEFASRPQARHPTDPGAAPVGPAPAGPMLQESISQIVGRLIIATEGRTTADLPLKIGRVIIGRTVDNDLQIDSRFVSRHHCQIITTAQGSLIEDLNSTNGIYVQGKRVRRHNLNDGDVVAVGKHEIMYVDERLPRARTSFTETIPGVLPAESGDADG